MAIKLVIRLEMQASGIQVLSPLCQLIDIHISFRSVTSKKIEQVYSGAKVNYSGNVTGVGIAFKF